MASGPAELSSPPSSSAPARLPLLLEGTDCQAGEGFAPVAAGPPDSPSVFASSLPQYRGRGPPLLPTRFSEPHLSLGHLGDLGCVRAQMSEHVDGVSLAHGVFHPSPHFEGTPLPQAFNQSWGGSPGLSPPGEGDPEMSHFSGAACLA